MKGWLLTEKEITQQNPPNYRRKLTERKTWSTLTSPQADQMVGEGGFSPDDACLNLLQAAFLVSTSRQLVWFQSLLFKIYPLGALFAARLLFV